MTVETCPNCADCPNRGLDTAHEAWWLAMCVRWGQCPDDPDAFWNMDRRQYEVEAREAKLDPEGYARPQVSNEQTGPYTHVVRVVR